MGGCVGSEKPKPTSSKNIGKDAEIRSLNEMYNK